MASFITSKNKKIAFTDQGSGRVLVLIHGFTETKAIWKSVADRLQLSCRVICIDLPGHGESDFFEEGHSMALQADCVQELLDHLKVRKAAVIGHSMGGYVTLEFAKTYPQYLSGFGLFHSHAAADTAEAKEQRNRMIETLENGRSPFLTPFFADLFAKGKEVLFQDEIAELAENARKMLPAAVIASQIGMRDRESYIDVLANANVPVLFILGKNDQKNNFMSVLAQTVLPEHSEVLIIPSGHMGFLENKQACFQFVKSFLEHLAE